MSNIIFIVFNLKEKRFIRILIGIIPTIIALTLTLFFPNIIIVLSICGGIFANILGFLIPLIIEIKNFSNSLYKKILNLILLFIFTFLLIITLINKFN